MKDILLVGGGGHCKAVIDVIESTQAWRIAGIVERRGSAISEVMGYEVVGVDDDLHRLRERCEFALVTCGQIKSPDIRIRLFHALKAARFTLPALVSARSHVARSATLGEGTVVMHAAHIGPDARIGANTIVNTRALIEHDAVVGNHCHVATTAVLNGGATIGDRSLIGSGAVCREGVVVGADCIVGMGTRVLKTLPDGALFIGAHAK
ncbi:acetyltransferase [Trinickia violacea]|uniref:Acetyltransferase n=1 Tax=Trinickia violacea TaxID=2571746 RepID=A0A4P8IVY9_9BURK|nr:NeuD/PglB/VioB family sugar acetyltransferase [Trinickia violacea]QCP53488.1 acetyltransferase [Trinickia violacea]